ncbi:hypothetical protein PTT_20366 [Pyrenophora teres f. teres 0-1]|uniref:DUF3433 domain containing protein n=1 Tax=Pyrenophora teres f. teres (strain 0-1) TaxID=861557 RepID=E3SAZ0_PYRTT|nr:hypothetical protein PTT_20366 [Pyrenophora teres f. teres 0-1]KAE8830517.1 hypothetical protein PTNB85_07104 [Pyrenophora teres f. teres]
MFSFRKNSQAVTVPQPNDNIIKSFVSFLIRRKQTTGVKQSSWKPSAFHPITLIGAILIAWALIAVLQVLLVHSQNKGGIILAPTTDDIPFGLSFAYLYLPTILALFFSIFWNWIDLQVKRVEPYYQLSRPDGAWGKDSLLISYPFDFLPLVPWSAFKSRHWAVFWASTCVVFVTWGVVPVQSGIFTTETISRTSLASFVRSEGFMPANRQSEDITARYIQSVHGIIWLNETLPPYMTREYILAPIKPRDYTMEKKTNLTWTSNTTLYSLDMKCETPTIDAKDETRFTSLNSTPTIVRTATYMSSNGCAFPTDYYSSFGNETIGPNESFDNQTIYDTKEFATVYIGYYSTEWANFYLEGLCPETSNHTFMALFTRNKKSINDPLQDVTRLYCTPFYYQQEVTATVDASTQSPLDIKRVGDKVPLPAEKWNSSYFEYQMNTGRNNEQPRGALPLRYWPDQLESVSVLPLSLGAQGTPLNQMAGFAVGATNHSLQELLDPEALRNAYEATYRIIFARSMAQILDQSFTDAKITNGSTTYMVGAVVVVPVFTYVVEGLLGFISLCSIALLIISLRREWSLRSDPATIASVMALVSDNPALLEDFAALDRINMEGFESHIKGKKFLLEYSERGNTITEADSFDPLDTNTHGMVRTDSDDSLHPKPVRPREFRSFMVLPFVTLLLGLAIALGVLLLKSQPHGIPRSPNTILRQILENYIPTALATLIEPVWVLINRLLCLLQPLEELRGGKAAAKKSIDADYSSLPPQLVVFKALRLSHFKLAAVCLMALLANVLAVAFSGVFEERSVTVPLTTSLVPPYEPRFRAINGSVGPNMPIMEQITMKPSGAYTGGVGSDLFLVAESNYTAGTPLPAWTDNQFMYMPFMDEQQMSTEDTEETQARTTAIGVKLECQQVQAQDWTASWFAKKYGESLSNISMTVDGITCRKRGIMTSVGPTGVGELNPVCQTGKVSMQFAGILEANQNASLAEQTFCAELAVLAYIRDANICSRNTTTKFNEQNAVFFGCRPRLIGGESDVLVSRDGRVQHVAQANITSDLSPQFLERHFNNNASNLLRQGNAYLFTGSSSPKWHNDSYAIDFMNYFMIKQSNNSRLIDPGLSLPTLEQVTQDLYPVYSKLFAIWLGINKRKLLVPREEGATFVVEGLVKQRQTRVFLSTPLFVMAEIILGIYIIVAVCIYLWRPGRFLRRMPTSIGAIIALFAASQAVREMRGTSLLTRRDRRKHLQSLGGTYGYGTFIGADGRLHEGIEKEPFVDAVPVRGVLENVQTGFSSKSSMFKRTRG